MSTHMELWDLATGKPRHQWEDHSYSIEGVGFLPGGTELMSVDWGGVYFWERKTGKRLRKFEQKEGYNLKPSLDGKRIVFLGDGTIHFWDLEKGSEYGRAEVKAKRVNCLSLSLDGRLAAFGSE